nr:Mpo1-like protein [Moraxella bovoculi]
MSLFVSNKSLQSWLDEYAVSHQDHTNKLIHVICVPVIFFDHCGFDHEY